MSFAILLVNKATQLSTIKENAQYGYGDMVKVVADLQKQVIAIGAEMHVDLESFLLEGGSQQSDLWGFNIYCDLPRDQWLEYDSMINIRPQQNNKSRNVEEAKTQEAIKALVDKLII